jgi:hypothetical protein
MITAGVGAAAQAVSRWCAMSAVGFAVNAVRVEVLVAEGRPVSSGKDEPARQNTAVARRASPSLPGRCGASACWL